MQRRSFPKLGGLPGYSVIWAGQLFSTLGVGTTAFALNLWLWRETGSATALSLVTLVTTLPLIVVAPFSGALIDRFSHHLKVLLLLGDAARLLVSTALLLLLLGGHLSLPLLYALLFIQASFSTFQWPADALAATVMLRPQDYGRGSSIQGVVGGVSAVLAAPLGALLFPRVGLSGVVLLDLLGSALALSSLALVGVPPVQKPAAKISLVRAARDGFLFIWRARSLLALQLVFLGGYFIQTFYVTLLPPMVLGRSGNDAGLLAGVEVAGGVAGIIWGLLLTAWGGPQRRVPGVLGGWLLTFVGIALSGIGQGLLPWAAGAACVSLGMLLFGSSNQALWQRMTPPHLQGSVFSARRVLACLTMPVASALAGPLADHVLTPAMQTGGSWVPLLGGLFGQGAGAGIGVFLSVLGLLGGAVIVILWRTPVLAAAEGTAGAQQRERRSPQAAFTSSSPANSPPDSEQRTS